MTTLKELVYYELAEEIASSALKGQTLVLKSGEHEINTTNIQSLTNLPEILKENTFQAIEAEQIRQSGETAHEYYQNLFKTLLEKSKYFEVADIMSQTIPQDMLENQTAEKRVLSTWTEKGAVKRHRFDGGPNNQESLSWTDLAKGRKREKEDEGVAQPVPDSKRARLEQPASQSR